MTPSDDYRPRPLAIVGGGSSGIGLAAARLLARRGCRVALLARDPARLSVALASLSDDGSPVLCRAVDLRDSQATRRTVEELCALHGPPLWLVASAGIVEPGYFLDQSVDLTAAQLDTNMLGAAHLVHAGAPAMVAAGRGHIVLVSSGAGLLGVAGYAGYCASKFALRGFGEALRIELAASGVSVTVSLPPDTDTPQLAYEAPLRPAEIAPFAGSGHPMSAEAVAGHMIAAAARGRFLSAPSTTLAMVARLQAFAIAPLVHLQLRLLRRRKRH